MRTVLLLATVLTLATLSSARLNAPALKQTQEDESRMIYFFQTFRGLAVGYENGLFKRNDKKSDCFDDETTKLFVKLIESFTNSQPDPSFIINIMNDGMKIGMNLQKCSVKGFTSLAEYCLQQEDDCGPQTIINNSQKNLFIIMGKMSDFTTLIAQFPAQTADEAYNLSYQMGHDVGVLIRVITGFHE